MPPTQIDKQLEVQVDKMPLSMKDLKFPEDLQNKELWLDCIDSFNRLSKEDTPQEKLEVIVSTL
jgi:hypothetical protein